MKKKLLLVNNIANTSPAMIEALSPSYDVTFKEFPSRKEGQNSINLFFKQIFTFIHLVLISKNFDIYYINYGHFGILGLFIRCPMYLHCHGTDLRNKRKNLFMFLTRIAMKTAVKVFVSTPNLIEEVPEIYRSKSVFIPNVVNSYDFNLKPTTIDQKSIKILIISKLDISKGIDEIFGALPKVEQLTEVSRITFFKFGNLRVKPILPKGDKYLALDKVPYKEIPKIILDHDIVIGQIELGAIGMSELEAMWMSKPVVANFQYDNFYKETCPILQASSSEEIVTQVKFLIDNVDNLLKIGKKSREWVYRHHMMQALSKQYGKLME